MQMKMVCPGRVTALDVTPDGAYCIAAISEKIHIWQVYIVFLKYWNNARIIAYICL